MFQRNIQEILILDVVIKSIKSYYSTSSHLGRVCAHIHTETLTQRETCAGTREQGIFNPPEFLRYYEGTPI